MEFNSKLISVIMSVYNDASFLNDAIDSILNQTYNNFEFIIVNDCSTDNSLSIINSYTDNRIKILNNESQLGLSKSLNKAIKIAQGDYIARMDADDYSYNTRFEKQIQFFTNNPTIEVLGTWCKLIDANGYLIESEYRTEANFDLIKIRAFFGSPMIHPSVMFSSNIIHKYLYNEEYLRSQDYELWTRLISDGIKMSNLQEFLLNYRIKRDNKKDMNRQTQIEFAKKIHNRYCNILYEKSNIDIYSESIFHFFFKNELPNKLHVVNILNFFIELIKTNNANKKIDKVILLNEISLIKRELFYHNFYRLGLFSFHLLNKSVLKENDFKFKCKFFAKCLAANIIRTYKI